MTREEKLRRADELEAEARRLREEANGRSGSVDEAILWWQHYKFKALIPNPLGGKRRVVAGSNLTKADEKRLREQHPEIYKSAKQGFELGLVCYHDVAEWLSR